MSARVLRLSFVAALAAAACSIDDRVLTNEDPTGAGGGGGATSGGGGSNVAGSSTGPGGSVGPAGSSNVAGGAGAGGAPVRDSGPGDTGVVELDSPLIDDCEDNNHLLLPYAGRRGQWIVFNDQAAGSMQSPASNMLFFMTAGGHNSKYAARTSGTGFVVWGSVMAAAFMPGNPTPLYNVSKYKGVTFWGKLVTGTLAGGVKVCLPDVNTLPVSDSGQCTGGNDCNDHFCKALTMTRDWAPYTALFSEVKQAGWGKPQVPALTLSAVQAIQFAFPPSETFDLWVDDVSFIQ